MPISAPEANDRCNVCTLPKEGMASQDHSMLQTRTSSDATEEVTSWLVPCGGIIPGKPCGQAATATSSQEELGEEGNCPSNPEI